MGQVIFSVDLKEEKISFVNNCFHNLFTDISKIPYNFTDDQRFLEIIQKAKESIREGNLGRFFLEENGQTLLFDVDKMPNDILVFAGKKFNTQEHIKTEEIYTFLRLLTDNLPDMVWAKDIHGKYLFANKAICDNLLMAKDTDEPIGKNDVFFALREREKHKDKKNWHTFGELCFDSDEIVLQNLKPQRFEEYGNIKGKLLYLEVHKAPFFDDEGRLLGTVGSGRDITEEVLTKNKLKEKDQLLLQQSKMAAIGEMLQNIAHQWRQPLSSISSISTSVIVQQQVGALEDEHLLHSMENLNNNAQYLSKTIDDFRDFFRPNKEKTYFDFTEIEQKALSLVSSKLNKSHIDIVSDFEDMQIHNYKNEFIQVLINILNNAIDALSEIETEKKKMIFISAVKKDRNIIIKIKDTAGGIPDEIMGNIFEPYFTTKHKKQGTGIGLYMCEEIITKHMDGTISVKNKDFVFDNTNFQGAEFKIVLDNY